MADLNKVILMGYMTADPELKQTTSGTSVCSFSIGVNRRYSKQDQSQRNVDFINIVAWGQRAEFVSRYFKKGSCITTGLTFPKKHLISGTQEHAKRFWMFYRNIIQTTTTMEVMCSTAKPRRS